MDSLTYIEQDLQKEFTRGIEGKIVSILKDQNSSATLFLEKIKDEQLSKTKYILHIKLWAVKDLIKLEKQTSSDIDVGQKNRVSLPLVFVSSQGFVDLE